MKHLLRHIFIWLFLFNGVLTFASHVLGGEISYKHIKDNQYKITLKIYRDCNGCKINGYGGGSSSEDCSEIDYLYVKGKNGTVSKETKFSLTREKVIEISPVCKSRISTCNSNSNSLFGIEMQMFTATIDLDDAKIKDLCNYYLYVSIAERNGNITTGQATQNFCVDAYINTCLKAENNSPDFVTQPVFILNSNKSQYQSFFSIDKDGDSLVYQLTSALSGIDKDANYASGFTYQSPLSVYCPEMPCTPNKAKEIGFYLDNANGSLVFIPIKESERAVIAYKVMEYRKIKDVWELIGYVKRDIEVYIKNADGNNSPKFISSDYYEVCEEELLEIKIETKDEQNNLTMSLDTNNFSLISNISGSSLTQKAQNSAPYNHAIFKWTPSKGSSANGIYTFAVSVKDNFCPVNSESIQIINIKVKPKEVFSLYHSDLGCGNYKISASQIKSDSKLLFQLYTIDKSKEIFKSNYLVDTISFLPLGKFILEGTLFSANGCKTKVIDTIDNFSAKTSAYILGDSKQCKQANATFTIGNSINPNAGIQWFFNSSNVGNGQILEKSFSDNGLLQALMSFQKGKWFCSDTLKKEIEVIGLPIIKAPDEIKVCHHSGSFDLNGILPLPVNGIWTSFSPLFNDHFINTNGSYYLNNDTLILTYEVTNDLNCKASKNINLILEAIPEFELSSISICELNTPILFEHLIKKPFNFTDYTYTWGLEFNPENIKEENGYKVFYSKDLGNGSHTYFSEITGKNGCKNRDTAVIEITSAVTVKTKNEINLCQHSGAIDISEISGITPEGGNWSFYDFELIKKRKFAQTDTCGQFEASYTYDNYGCYDTKKIKISIACKPEIKIIGLPTKLCDFELPLVLNAIPTGGVWTGNYISGKFFSPPLSNEIRQYSLTYSLQKGDCYFKETRDVNVIPSPVLNLVTDKINYCNNEPITITGRVMNTRFMTINYSGDKDSIKTERYYQIVDTKDFNNEFILKTIFDKATTSQFLRVSAAHEEGCEVVKELKFNVYDQPEIIPFRDTFVCENSGYIITPIIIYNGNEPLFHSWSKNSIKINNTKNLNTSELSAGKHLLNFKSDNTYCSDSKSINLEVKPKPMVDFSVKPTNTTTIMQPNFWFINQSGLNQSWLWNFGSKRSDKFSTEHSPQYSYTDTGNYLVSLTGTDNFGCSNTIYQTVVVRPDLLIFIPNAFSPNNKDEERNNVFSISLDNYNSYSIEIYDRWGHKVFYSENPEETWDGKSGNVICTPDIYFYLIKINSITNNLYKYRGTITLIK